MGGYSVHFESFFKLQSSNTSDSVHPLMGQLMGQPQMRRGEITNFKVAHFLKLGGDLKKGISTFLKDQKGRWTFSLKKLQLGLFMQTIFLWNEEVGIYTDWSCVTLKTKFYKISGGNNNADSRKIIK